MSSIERQVIDDPFAYYQTACLDLDRLDHCQHAADFHVRIPIL